MRIGGIMQVLSLRRDVMIIMMVYIARVMIVRMMRWVWMLFLDLVQFRPLICVIFNRVCLYLAKYVLKLYCMENKLISVLYFCILFVSRLALTLELRF